MSAASEVLGRPPRIDSDASGACGASPFRAVSGRVLVGGVSARGRGWWLEPGSGPETPELSLARATAVEVPASFPVVRAVAAGFV